MYFLEESLMNELDLLLLENYPPILTAVINKIKKKDVDMIFNLFAIGPNSEQIDISADEARKAVGLVILVDDKFNPFGYFIRDEDGTEKLGMFPSSMKTYFDENDISYSRINMFKKAAQFIYITPDEQAWKKIQQREERGEYKTPEKITLPQRKFIETPPKGAKKELKFGKGKTETLAPTEEQKEEWKKKIKKYVERKLEYIEQVIPDIKKTIKMELDKERDKYINDVRKGEFYTFSLSNIINDMNDKINNIVTLIKNVKDEVNDRETTNANINKLSKNFEELKDIIKTSEKLKPLKMKRMKKIELP